jgi:hypothetical protein
MQGIQSLMPGQAQQAPMPGMMPQQSSSTPGAMTGSLKNMPMEQLKMLFLNPQPGSPPLWAVISALAEKQKEAQAIQAAMGQGAMAQNAQMQQQPPVAAQVVQAAEGGIMQGYAGGGAVAFGRGGNVQHFRDGSNENGIQSFMERFPKDSGARMLYEWIKAGRPALKKPILDALVEKEQQVVESTTDTGDEMSRMLGRAPAPVPMSMRDTRGATPETVAAARNLGIGQPQQPQQPQQRQEAAQAAPMASAPGITSTLSSEEARLFEERKAALEARKRLPPELLEGRTGLAKLMQENLAAQRAEAKTFGDESRAARDAAIARSQRSLLDDPQALLAMAGAIDPRRGRSIGSLAQGAAGVLGQRQAAAEAARKEYATSQQTERMLQANIRQGNMLEAQRVQALLEGDYNRANQIDDAINQNAAERTKLERSVQDKSREFNLEERKLTQQGQISREQMQSQERVAAANRAASAALRNLPSVEQQMAERVMMDYMAKNPGSTLSDAWDFYRGSRASSAADRNLLARQKLLAEDPLYKLARMQESQEKDPAKKAEAQRKVQEFERKAGIVDVPEGSGNITKYDAQGNPIR